MPHALDAYNIVWKSQSESSSASMPCGGGDIGLNVWVEDGDVLFYMQRSGSLAEQNEYLKLGRIRLQLSPNPFLDSAIAFHQELKLHEGYVEIRGVCGDDESSRWTVVLQIWVEVHRPVIHVEVDASKPIGVKASYENWRLEDEVIQDRDRAWSCMSLQDYPEAVTLQKDTVAHTGNGVLFYHRNPGDGWLLHLLLKQQGLESYHGQLVDDLSNRTFGGLMTGEGFVAAGYSDGYYLKKAFRGWHLASENMAQSHHLRIGTHIAQTDDLQTWQTALDALVDASSVDLASVRQATLHWWNDFWSRSTIIINPDAPDNSNRPWRIGRNYNLFRYQLACNAFGEYPTKFNGGNFTFDASDYGPDWRRWGGGVFTAQNQRLLYWPMLRSGDADVMLPQFELYRKALPGAQARVQANFKHDGAVYAEYIGASGIAPGFGYGWKQGHRGRGEELPFGDPRADAAHQYHEPVETGVMANKAISYHWESQLEHAYMILEYHRYFGTDITRYIPFIENAVVFFDAHYRKREVMRSGRELDENNHLVIFPSKACETFRGAANPTDLIAGLHACVDGILDLDDCSLTLRDKAYYRALKASIPPYTFRDTNGINMILPAKSWKRRGNAELPMLYPLFPFNQFALGKDDMQVFRDTYKHGDFRKGNIVSWHQDGIFFARMGMTEEAVDFNSRKLDDSPRRFPTFWGPGHDWMPDHNWGGSGMIGLQEMLMQTIGKEIRLLPAWPRAWSVDFRLHAPYETIVEASVRNGRVERLLVQPESRRTDVVLPND